VSLQRVEEYRVDGRWSPLRRDAVIAPVTAILAALHGHKTTIPARYFLATAEHESGRAVNERDTEPSGFRSWGIYQISRQEAADVVMADADLLNLATATEVMMRLAERNREAIRAAAHLDGQDPPDMGAYLAIAHNQGRTAVRRTIEHYGMSWKHYRRRNPGARIVAYGDDCVDLNEVEA
jgi:hypothetical protein